MENKLAHVKAVLLDIEGTTTPVSFVYETLFPYANREIENFLQRNSGDSLVHSALEALHQQREADLLGNHDIPVEVRGTDVSSLAGYARWLMSQDSKVSALKTLQGMIWEQGYERGDLKGIVFDDVPPAMQRWREQGRRLFIYSSGSILAQKLIFGNSNHGDLTHLLNGYFDTSVGVKGDVVSYQRISQATKIEPVDFLFISDTPRELDAASAAGFQTFHSVRPGNPQTCSPYTVVQSFDEVPF